MKIQYDKTYWVEYEGNTTPFRAHSIVGIRVYGHAVIDNQKVDFVTDEDRLLLTDAKPGLETLWRNLKTNDTYKVIKITRDSETLCSRVVYTRVDSSDTTEWDRPLALFMLKFEPL